MKKSKIIVPALGILLLSTAASISGTVAWFTASRTFATNVSSFGVGSIDGELKATVEGGVGTKQGADTSTILFATDSPADGTETVLTDASYDSSAKLVYTDNAVETERADTDKQAGVNESDFKLVGPSAQGTRVDGNLKAGSKTVSSTTVNYYYAVTWTITLKYEGAATADQVHMLFDSSASSITATGTKTQVANGIRFNFEVNNASKVNYAPLRNAAGVKNVATTTTTEATEQLIALDTKVANADKMPDNKTAAEAATYKEYLGTVAPDTDFVVTVTCWLEGLDADVLTSNLDSTMKITGNLNFYCRTAKAA